MTQNDIAFDDELEETENEDDAVSRGIEMAESRAVADAPADFCASCVEDTPLAFSNASDAHTVRFIRDAAEAVADHIEQIGGEFTDRFWVKQELQDAYVEAYFDACADPEECEVCQHPDTYDGCGHERYGEPCPVRSEA